MSRSTQSLSSLDSVSAAETFESIYLMLNRLKEETTSIRDSLKSCNKRIIEVPLGDRLLDPKPHAVQWFKKRNMEMPCDLEDFLEKLFQEVAGTAGVYTFEIDDRWKDTLINGATDLILDDDAGLFPINSVIPFHVYDVPALLNYTAGTDLRYLGAAASADILIEVGDDCRLKKIDLGIWELVVGNKSTGGSGTVTNVSGTTNEITVSSPTTTPVISISSTYTTARDAYADAKVADTINNGTTTIAPSQNAVFDALDFTRRLITKGTGSVTGTVSETIITTLTIPANTLDSSCFIWTTMDFFKTNFGTVTTRLYINNANTLTGATLLGFYVGGSYRNVSFNRKFLVTGTSLDLLTANTVSTQVTNEFIEALFGASTVLTINPSADIFLIYTTQNDATGTVATNKMATVQKMKL